MARRKFQALGVYKRVHINPETRRMTLPEPFYDALRLEDELLIAQVGDVLVMRRGRRDRNGFIERTRRRWVHGYRACPRVCLPASATRTTITSTSLAG